MNREEFITELEKKLRKLPNEERQAAIVYYNEYFQEAGEDKEKDVIEELGNPSEVASQIMANYAAKEIEANNPKEKKLKSSMSTVWIIILAILASPIALPIALAIVILVLTVWIVIMAFWITGVAFIVAGLVYIVLSVLVVFQDIPLGMLVVGIGLLSTGLGILLTKVFTKLFILYSSCVTKKISKSILRKGNNNEEE